MLHIGDVTTFSATRRSISSKSPTPKSPAVAFAARRTKQTSALPPGLEGGGTFFVHRLPTVGMTPPRLDGRVKTARVTGQR